MTPERTAIGDWTGTLEHLQFRVRVLQGATRASAVLLVAIVGDYRRPESRADGGALIEMILGAASSNPRGPCTALVLDLAELTYTGGDRLLDWRHSISSKPGRVYPFAIITSDSNRQAIRSLIEYEDDHELEKSLHGNLEEALRFLGQ
jgi:hypothetical protein